MVKHIYNKHEAKLDEQREVIRDELYWLAYETANKVKHAAARAEAKQREAARAGAAAAPAGGEGGDTHMAEAAGGGGEWHVSSCSSSGSTPAAAKQHSVIMQQHVWLHALAGWGIAAV